ncbi:Cystinosin [Strongyloides ratti]|uniref:Cystinosin homolog n=1 Tax=Strongyloides ratti TaxID=34506 RepID=A0A090KTK4_STRRB|nr:Cystinosin [Strongyloides ratti]CEF60845.1 Cystinosin [Strongyloides ratti]
MIFFLIAFFNCFTFSFNDGGNELISYTLDKIEIIKDEPKLINFKLKKNISYYLNVALNYTDSILKVEPNAFIFTSNVSEINVTVTGYEVQSLTFIDLGMCKFDPSSSPCKPLPTESFLRVKIIHSDIISYLVVITGWIYFIAWSISFYPQIYLNFKRKSVVGLNFDFLLLNVIGFTCYSIYNILMYYDPYVQDLYHQIHKRSLIPVLLNDVIFAIHALFACIVTVIQCFIYTRENQRVSYTCYGLSSILILAAGISFILSLVNVINWLQFINNLSYLKMIVTLSKYFPQALLNYKRKSTVGWSIGNVLLDFTGGFMDIVQMILQGSNTNDWTGFYGNPVKFGLGLVSMLFDIIFIIQHYFLYKNDNERDIEYTGIDNTTDNASTAVSSPSNNSNQNDEN